MKRLSLTTLATVALSASMVGNTFAQQTTLRVFSGGQNQRPDLMRKLFDEYQKANPNVKIDIETGGATSELQRQYLSTVLNAKDSAIDIYLIDIVNPAQYLGAGWLEPLDAYVGGPNAMKPYLPVYAQANVVNGKVAAMPAFADAMFMYYRKDLLEKYGIKEPKTWDELAAASKKIQDGEKNPNLQGLSIQGAPIEGAVCTFLLPYWSMGKAFNDGAGKMTLDKDAAAKGMDIWLKMVDQGVIKKNVAEVTTPATVNEFKAGQVAFAINWGFAWDRFKDDADSQVKGKVGVMPLPAVAGGKSATCVGGWQWAVSAFSKSKPEAAKLVQYMASPSSSKFLAVEGSLLPTIQSVYTDADVTKAVPWFKDAANVVIAGQARPISARYGEVSDAIRTTASAILARTKTPAEGVAEIDSKLSRVMR
ncbi:MAG TPA: ABC transporter substrate-binding protein [Burkholderiaceae bacterium]|jgi:multiple sugar transport system substrate-binding protein|nr:ABC transporter substrate-binding protein [Rhodoferax sp.]HNW00617.1 ABC transporter substrate-binding protein [Burkholderiaceae bacterium]MBP6493166.1 ABC transporter substrate-binding protein [Rhodoferax sp.]MBP7573116.1 ABC transporter substrate-binding protein [Rhodoferax sp.]MBP8135196.1 ABC transporter substrate-binding protein [Rhodoferax sp.]